MSLKSINPANGEVIREYDEKGPAEVEKIIEETDMSFQSWRHKSFAARADLMENVAGILEEKAEDYGRLMAQEMGKPLPQGIAEAKKCAWVCRYYAQNAEKFLQPETIKTDAKRSYAAFLPLGVVLAIMPWNFPFWQVFRFAAPALMAGNAALLKHASNVSGCALEIERIFREAGFPQNIFNTLLIGSDKVNSIIDHPLVEAVTLTGSEKAGRAVGQKAGEMLKKSVLELGGSDPYLVLEDADLEQTVTTCVESRLINSGQSCIAAKRFIVVDAIREEFEKLFVQKMREKRMGDPLADGTEVGPQARWDLREDLHRQVTQSIEKGAKCLLGGELPGGKGAFYPPTVLTDVGPGMPAFDEEVFGPVAAIIPVKDEEEAIRVANNTKFGLAAAVFTKNTERGERIAAEELDAGSCFVNTFVKSDPRLPFGGIKSSGYGRELSHYGIKEFVNIKTVYVA